MESKKSNSVFCIINVVAWLFFYVIQALTSPLFLVLPPLERCAVIFTFIFWIMLITGTYRFIFYKFNFKNRSLKFNLLQVFISAVIMWTIDLFLRTQLNFRLFNFAIVPWHDSAYSNPIKKFTEINDTNPNFKIVYDTVIINAQLFKFYAYLLWLSVFTFFSYYSTLQNTRIEKLRFENQAKDAELARLRSQLNPHFLFNALNSIHSLTMFDPPKSSEAVMLLSDLMRNTLNYEHKELVTIREEMDTVKKIPGA
ncbi:MAG: histidine kinase [Bacteroidia bacterium]